jgi:hypothetical protein
MGCAKMFVIAATSEVRVTDPEEDQGRLLPGEPEGSRHVDDAAHWVAVYTELTRFLTSSGLPLPHTMERYLQRLDFWRQRLHELNGQGSPPA